MSNLGLECHHCWQGTTARTLMYAVVPLTPSGVVYARFKLKCQSKTEGASRKYNMEKWRREGLATQVSIKTIFPPFFQEGSVGGLGVFLLFVGLLVYFSLKEFSLIGLLLEDNNDWVFRRDKDIVTAHGSGAAGYCPFTWGFSGEPRYCQIFALEKRGSVQPLSRLFSQHC